MSESTPKIDKRPKRLERLERATLDGFSPLSDAQIAGLGIDVRNELIEIGVIEVFPVENKEFHTEVLGRSDADGIELCIATLWNEHDGTIAGVLTQAENDTMIGRTTFTDGLIDGKRIAHVGRADTYLHAREGFGEERLRIIHEYTKKKFSLPLSSINREPPAQALWDSLLARGLATREDDGSGMVIYTMV